MENIKKRCLCDKEITDNCAIICKDCTDKIMEGVKNDKVPDFVKKNSFCSSLVLLGIIHNGFIKDEKRQQPKKLLCCSRKRLWSFIYYGNNGKKCSYGIL